MSAPYLYWTVTLERGAWPGFAAHLRGQGGIFALFQGQLGFSSNEAVVLTRGATLDGVPGVIAAQLETLTPTVRPAEGATLKPGGIHVHRWFTVDGDRIDDFIALSNKAWETFEGSYETQIFGLFTARKTPDDIAAQQGRLLLLTYYASHGVWEASRDQTRDPAGLFVRRHALTRATIGRSTLLVNLAG